MKHRSILLFTFFLLPFIANANKPEEKGTGIVAHRGFWNCEEAGYARNSIAALRCAQEAGFWGSEFDVNMTADGVLLVFHDNNVEGKKIEKHPYEAFKYFRLENGEPIPTVDQYLEQAKKYPQTRLVYEIKAHSTSAVEDKVVDLSIEKLKEYELLDPSKVVFISFSYHMCKRLAEKLPEFTIQYLNGEKSPSTVLKDGVNGIDYHHTILSLEKKWVRTAHRLDMSVNAWTVNDKNTMLKMLKLEVDQLTTDNPLIAREVMKENGINELR
jgi:glycerophosphoryl diester phosphodiesterase